MSAERVGKWIAICDGEIIGAGATTTEASMSANRARPGADGGLGRRSKSVGFSGMMVGSRERRGVMSNRSAQP